MLLRLKHSVQRLNNGAPVLREKTLGRFAWTLCAAAKRNAGEASGSFKSHFPTKCCRKYASDAAYGRVFAAARDNPEKFWADVGRDINWFEPWSKTLHVEDPVFPNW